MCGDQQHEPYDPIGDDGGVEAPKVAYARARDALGRFTGGRLGLYPCKVPGVSLTDYSPQPNYGWGTACTQSRTTITLTNGVRVTVASGVAELLRIILNECLRRGYKIRQADTGAYNCRYIGGTTTWSVHAWALAIDINWQSNPFSTTLRTDIPTWMRALLNRYGFAWGGDWSGKKDAMHFQFMGTPTHAKTATAMARQDLLGVDPDPVPTPTLPVVVAGSRILEWDPDKPIMSGTDVQALQRVLNRWYPELTPLTADGYYGQKSAQRVLYFQGRAGLTQDGICGPRTWDALGF